MILASPRAALRAVRAYFVGAGGVACCGGIVAARSRTMVRPALPLPRAFGARPYTRSRALLPKRRIKKRLQSLEDVFFWLSMPIYFMVYFTYTPRARRRRARERWQRTRRRNRAAVRAHLWCALRGWSEQRDGAKKILPRQYFFCGGSPKPTL
jgi:hypothetical protein